MNQQINGYEVRDEWFLGNGSFGAVYKASKDNKFYAIKIFRTEYVKSDFGKDRIDREIKCLQKINNPNVVKFYEFGNFKSQGFDYFYLVMDYIDGQPLTKYIGILDEKKIKGLMEAVLKTLDSIHNNDILHRDLKPQNILIKSDLEPVILDFGLAKLIDYSSITQTGDQLGTYAYMSPEQVVDSKNIDKLSDYFALGVIFYQLITGKLPYDATNTPALIDQIKNQYPKPPSDINPAISNQLENVILKLLEKQPYRRYQSVQEIISAVKSQPSPVKKLLGIKTSYYVRLLHTEKEIIKDGLNLKLVDNIIFPANFFKKYHLTVDVLKKSKVTFVTDPSTNRLTYTAFSKTIGLKELPYSSGNDVNPIQKKDFHSINQIQSYVQKVLEYQIANGNTHLAAPFFYIRDINDEWFNINLKLLRESIAYRDLKYKDMPVWGGICMNIENWYDDDVKNTILNRYVRWAPDGYFVYGDSVGIRSDLAKLYHYADLLLKLQKSTSIPVVACRVNGVGLVFLATGLAGISSGISSLDNFDESILSDINDRYSMGPRYYIPELLSMISLEKNVPTKLLDIAKSSIGNKLKCNCDFCKSIYENHVSTSKNIKMHYLVRKKQEIDELSKLSDKDKIIFIIDKLNNAINFDKILRDENIKIVNDTSYLRVWKSLAEKFRN